MVATSSRRSTRAARSGTTRGAAGGSAAGQRKNKRKAGQQPSHFKSDKPVTKWCRIRRSPGPGIGFQVWTWKPLDSLSPEEHSKYAAPPAGENDGTDVKPGNEVAMTSPPPTTGDHSEDTPAGTTPAVNEPLNDQQSVANSILVVDESTSIDDLPPLLLDFPAV